MAAKRKKSRGLSPAQAERQTKQAAKKRRIVIELTEEQLAALSKQYGKLNPAEAAELVFTVKKRPTSKLKIAGYSYHGDTCCV
jgi:hypothetical protein